MVSFSITNAKSDLARSSITRYAKNFFSQADHPFYKFALDNSGEVFIILCKEEYDKKHPKKDDGYIGFKADAISAEEHGKIITLATLFGELPENDYDYDTSYANDLSSLYPNHGIGREMMLFWESLTYEHTDSSYIDMIAINGEKNIPMYKKLGYRVVENFEYTEKPDENGEMIAVPTSAFMTKDFTVKDFFLHKGYLKSKAIYDSANQETRDFILDSEARLDRYLEKINKPISAPKRSF